ncbi:uncharacterized protein LOC124165357 isoform X1 [Ischnura elegans]|uniref:uncharacterized protein LOC124165357 isoform X1 n=1 Tax=Ischnura elegans TaxID=197161 RepID=UPI001ED87D08|nr:uncharacterized protein LOC124165357 isoform X1 [Ischnura elegans]
MKLADVLFPRKTGNISMAKMSMGQMKMERFSMDERSLLMSLIDKYIHILDVKKTDAASNAAKVKSWFEIERQFNDHGFVIKRNWRQLRKAWENIKCKRKRELAHNIHERTRIGGGPCTSTSADIFLEAEVTQPCQMKREEVTGRTEGHGLMVNDPRELAYEVLREENERLIMVSVHFLIYLHTLFSNWHAVLRAEPQRPSTCLLTPGDGSSSCDSETTQPQSISCHASVGGELELRVESVKSMKDAVNCSGDDDVSWIKRRTAELELRLKEIEVSKAEKLKELEVTMAENSLAHQRKLMALELRERRRQHHHQEEMRQRERLSYSSSNI